MASGSDLKQITKMRLQTVQTLIKGKDWDAAAYIMGHVLETALKAASCKALGLSQYPEFTKNKMIDNCFMSHKFDQLIIISGLSNSFSLTGLVDAYRNWSEFVQEYPGDWIAMRYDQSVKLKFNEAKVKRLYENLYKDKHSIIKVIMAKKKW